MNATKTENPRVMEQVCDLVLTQYLQMENRYNRWEISALQEASQKGMTAFGEACHNVLGVRLSAVVRAAIQEAQHANRHAYHHMTDGLNDEDASVAIVLASELALACEVLQKIQQQYHCDGWAQSTVLTKSAADYAKAIYRKCSH